MSQRAIASIILTILAIGAALLIRNMVGGLIAAFLIVLMLFLWAIPPNYGSRLKKPDWKPLSLAFVGIGVGLFASIAALLILPPQVFPWVLVAVGVGLIIWFFISGR